MGTTPPYLPQLLFELPAPGRRLIPRRNAAGADLVMTEPALARRICQHFQPSGRLLDPARGRGAFYKALQAYGHTEWCELVEGRDFMQWNQRVDWIITNPPWSKLRAFLRHSMTVADNIVFLVTVVHIATKARLRDMREAGFGIAEIALVPPPPHPWPESGFQPAAIHIKRGGALFTELRPGR